MSIAWSMLLLRTQRLLRALLREWTVEACPILLLTVHWICPKIQMADAADQSRALSVSVYF